ncbi:hypothetical protein [Paenibacillus sp. PL91]|uniref:hypothetical protein n=1 Tax=Paenibacillus sp. PL91 TaxID=2729538 RepID=UPI00145D6A5F|nr:hypothetical protein [Paenibacillus sp. PL91]MBC9205051.1 hypothetical protein [Paenibacillus sp. PL91]
MNIRTRSYLSFGLILFLFLSSSIYQLVQSSKQVDEIKEVNETTLKAALIAQDLEQILNTYQIQILLPAVGAATQESIKPLLERYIAEFTDKATTYAKLKPDENENIQEIMRIFSDFVKGNNEEATRLNELAIKMGNDNAVEINNSLGDVVQISEETSENTILYQVFVLTIAVLLSYYFTVSLTRPIRQLIDT